MSAHLKQILDHAQQARNAGLFAVVREPQHVFGVADLGMLYIRGPGAGAFLHGQVTNEVNGLSPGEGNLSARVTGRGTLTRIFSLHRLPSGFEGDDEAFVLLLERAQVSGLREDLDKYLFSDEITLEDRSGDLSWLLLQGPQAHAVAAQAWGPLKDGAEESSWAELPEHAVRAFERPGLPPGALVFAESLTGDSGLLIAAPSESEVVDILAERAEDAAQEFNMVPLREAELADVLEVLRVEAGTVRIHQDVEEGQRVLPETGLEGQVVSYAKGCYLGQEVIARIRTYGSTNYALRGVVLSEFKGEDFVGDWGEALENLPDVGGPVITEDDKTVGRWASRTVSPVLKAPIAMAFLDKASRTPGTKLILQGKRDDFRAEVVMLPFYRAADRKTRARFLHEQAVHAFADHQDDRSIELLEEALRLDPGLSDAYEALGVILGRGERFHEAIDIFKRLEEVAPNEPMVHTNLSLYYMKIGDKETAEEEKAKATLKRFTGFADTKLAEEAAKAEAAQRRADAEQKMVMFEEVLGIDAEDPLALMGMGNALATLDRYTEAETYLARARVVQKDNSPLYAIHGKVLEKLERLNEAIEVYRQGIEVASRKGDLMPLKEMEHRMTLLKAAASRKGT